VSGSGVGQSQGQVSGSGVSQGHHPPRVRKVVHSV
jgi:hypothetical protein